MSWHDHRGHVPPKPHEPKQNGINEQGKAPASQDTGRPLTGLLEKEKK